MIHMDIHEITVKDKKIYRDASPVKIIAYVENGDLRIGCTHVTREALILLLEMSNRYRKSITGYEIVQEGNA